MKNSTINEVFKSIDWETNLETIKLSEETLRDLYRNGIFDKEAVVQLFFTQNLSESFIKQLLIKKDIRNNSGVWYAISKYQKLSESFIIQFEADFDLETYSEIYFETYWENIFNWQKLSESFKEEFKKKLK